MSPSGCRRVACPVALLILSYVIVYSRSLAGLTSAARKNPCSSICFLPLYYKNPLRALGIPHPSRVQNEIHIGNVIALVPHLLRGLLPLPRGADECSEEESPQLCLFPLTPIYEPNMCCRDSSPQKGFGMTNGCLTMKVKGLPCV